MPDPHDDYSRIETLTWTLAVALRRKLGGDYRIQRTAWSGGQGQGLELTAGADEPMFVLSFQGWGGNHLLARGRALGHPLEDWVWAALTSGSVSIETLARDAAAAARPYRGPARRVDEKADAYATTAYDFIAAAMRASLVRDLAWEVNTVVPLDDGMGGDGEHVDLETTWARPYLTLFDESLLLVGERPQTTDDVADWHFIQGPAGPVCAVDPATGVYLPGVGRILFADWSRGPAWQSVLRLLDPRPGVGADPLGTPGTGLTVALAAQTHTAALVEHGLGSARLVDLELHGPALSLRPAFRVRLGKAAQLTVPARAWVGRAVRADQVRSALSRHLPVKQVDPDGVAADLVVAWTQDPSKGASPFVIAVFVAADTGSLARVATFVERVEAAGPVELRVVVVDLDSLTGLDGPEVLRPSDLI